MKVYIVRSNHQYESMFRNWGWDIVDNVAAADLVQFTGGSDVSPSLYHERSHPTTYASLTRDVEERSTWDQCRALGKPMAGICRGGQFLNVMCGGSMYQNVDNHAIGGLHGIVSVRGGRMIPATSTHHQMMRPGLTAEVIAVASESTVYEYMDNNNIAYHRPQRGEDIEVVMYSLAPALCFQPHPEYLDAGHPCQEYYFELIEELLCVG